MGGPCQLLKLNWSKWGTHGVQMKGALPWLVRQAQSAGTWYFCPALAALVSLGQKCIFSSPHTIAIHLSPSPSMCTTRETREGWPLLTLQSDQYKKTKCFFPRRTLFQFIGPHRLASWAVVPRRLSHNICPCVQQIHPDVASSLPSMNAAPRRKFAQVRTRNLSTYIVLVSAADP
jgi:hypothetical protein